MTTTQQTIIDLQSLIEQHAPTRLQKVATSHGGEFAGMCPWCQGTDRFRVWPFSERPHYWCRGCGKAGDHIAFLMEWCNMSFVSACEELGIEPGETISHAAPMFFDDDPPPKKWQETAELVVLSAEKYLWNKAPHALDYLRKRGFNDETIQQARLGYVPLAKDGTWYQRPFEAWGLTDEMLTDKQKAKGGVKVPPGILIPWYADGQLWKLAIKRFEAREDEMPYGQVTGSKDALYNSDALERNKPVVLVEGEFDALSVHQEARDLIATIATGSTVKARIPLWIAKFSSLANCVLLSFDLDDNNSGGNARALWRKTLSESIPWPPFSHDCNDMLKEGKSIRKWVELGLSLMEKPIEKQEEQPLQGSTETRDVSHCCVCGTESYVILEDDTAYCEQHWPQPPAQPAYRYCKQCGKETLRDNSDGLCSWCYKETLTPVEPPKEPYNVKNAWL
jgi:DNA primase